jgi:hypothetical protein
MGASASISVSYIYSPVHSLFVSFDHSKFEIIYVFYELYFPLSPIHSFIHSLIHYFVGFFFFAQRSASIWCALDSVTLLPRFSYLLPPPLFPVLVSIVLSATQLILSFINLSIESFFVSSIHTLTICALLCSFAAFPCRSFIDRLSVR